MDVAVGMATAQFERDDAARAELDRRCAAGVARAVGGDGEVSLQQVRIVAHEAGDMRAPDLLLALEQQDDVAGQFAVHLEMGFDRQDLGEVLALVVADAARIKPPVADCRLEGRRDPLLDRVGRLYVVVSVEQHGRFARCLLPSRHHHRVALGGDEAGFEADPREHLDKQGADLGDADVLGADARMAQIGDQALQEAVAVGIDMREDGGQCVGRSHHMAPDNGASTDRETLAR